MMELLTISDIWSGCGEVSGQNLTEAPRVVKCVKVDEEFVVIGMGHCSVDLCLRSTVSSHSAGTINCVAALPAFTVVLSVKDE